MQWKINGTNKCLESRVNVMTCLEPERRLSGINGHLMDCLEPERRLSGNAIVTLGYNMMEPINCGRII